MRVFGVDFTSAPRRAKPITCAACLLRGERLVPEGIHAFTDFAGFDDWLASAGPWVAGMDFPFGQPRRLIDNLGWPGEWRAYVPRAASLGMKGWERLLGDYRAARPAGDKQHLRRTDALADARSPMTLYGVPVGRMFLRGAPRLLASALSLPPCRPTRDPRTALETYPALTVRHLVGRRPYKHDSPARRTQARRDAREEIIAGLASERLRERYGVRLVLGRADRRRLADEGSADGLDALLCAIQAAWAWRRRDRGWGIPQDADPVEGWICDPELLADGTK
ncbi:MAG: DUF429 domain-containing protein [Chromatiales bacterium]